MNYNKYGLAGLNVLCWLAVLLWMSFAYMGSGDFNKMLLRNVITILSMAGIVYFNFYCLLTAYFFQKKYIQYFAILTIIVLSLTFLRVYLDSLLLDSITPIIPENKAIFSNMHYTVVLFSFVAVLIVSSLFKVSTVYYKNLQLQQQLENQQLEAELKFLKAQVNPHFLFNTLNNIYTLSYMKSEKATLMIMKLSELMRYMLYDSNQPKVDLQKEIQYLQNYIELQRLKTPDEQKISLEVEGNPQGIRIEPMLLVPLLENSFKHGNIGDDSEAWVRSKLIVNTDFLHFVVENSLPPTPKQKDKQGGIGLENVEKRLQLLYPEERHEFCVQHNKEKRAFFASIKIFYYV